MQLRSRREENAAATRDAIVEEAHAVFAAKGFQKGSLDDIARRARVTKGALYHHFANKKVLFEAAIERQMEAITKALAEWSERSDDPWEDFILKCEGFLDYGKMHSRDTIPIQEAIQVLGWQRWRELDMNYGMGLVQSTVQSLLDERVIKQGPPELLSDLIFGLMVEASMSVVRAKDKPRAYRAARKIVIDLLSGLKAN